MNSKRNSERKVNDLIEKIEQTDNMSDVQNIIISQIKNPQCKEVAIQYFKCMEENTQKLSKKKKIKKNQIDDIVENKISPYCMKKFNVESCLSK
jgi:hypothetical protein